MADSATTEARRWVRISHRPSGTPLAEGPVGWNITPFEGNFYIRRKFLRTDGFKPNFIPGLCFYKFLYVWMDLVLAAGERVHNLGWMYWLPNPLFPFIWFRVGIPQSHPEIEVEYSIDPPP
jgi:uncharacterized protein (DUF427 family)